MKSIGTTGGCMRVVSVALGLVLVSAAATAAQPGTWAAGADLPAKRYFAAAASLNDTIFVIGGSPDITIVDTLLVYDPADDTWLDENRTPMPTARSMAAAAVVDGKIFVIGGALDSDFNATAAVEAYDPVTDTWESRTGLSSPRWGPAVAVVDGKIYVVGGGTGDAFGEFTTFPTVEVYDPVSGTWEPAADMPTARGMVAAAAVDGIIYAAGGVTETGFTAALEVYDPATDSWTTGADMLTGRDSFAAVAVAGKVYAFGGLVAGEGIGGSAARCARDAEVYDPGTDTWVQATIMPEPKWGVAAAVVDGTVHLIGGGTGTPHPSGDYQVESYDPDRFTSWTEVAAHLPGSYDSQWRTDVCAINEGAEQANVEVVLHADTGDHSIEAVIGGGQQQVFSDIVGSMEIEGKGTLEVRSDQPLRFSGRIFSEDESGTYGQSCEFRPLDDGFGKGDTAWLVGLRQEEVLYRTNLTIANTGIRDANMSVKLFAGDGTELHMYPIVLLPPGGLVQDLEPFANRAGQPDLGWGYATVEVVSGAGVRISSSVIDSKTNDATTIVAQR